MKIITKKRVFLMIAGIILTIFLIHLFFYLVPDKTIEMKKVTFTSSHLPADMNGYQVAFVTDIHIISDKDLNDTVEKINEWKPDLLTIGGDFSYDHAKMDRALELLSKVNASDGIYGVEGNHDVHETLFASMEKYGITPLSNNGLYIRKNFYLAGVEDLWNRNADIAMAASEAKEDDFVLLLAHNPDVTMKQNTSNIDLTLSGHTHGGHVTFFGLWAPALTRNKVITGYGQRFKSGWAESRDGTSVYVSRGIGTFERTPRVFARQQVVLFTLRNGQ